MILKTARLRSVDENGKVLMWNGEETTTYFACDEQEFCCEKFETVLDAEFDFVFDENESKVFLRYHYRELDEVVNYCPFCGEKIEYAEPSYTKETRRYIVGTKPVYANKEVKIIHDTGKEEVLWDDKDLEGI